MQELIERYYAPLLREEGFISYKDEGFHWYRIRSNLLHKVHLPISSPVEPVCLYAGYGAIPLFSWEHIAPAGSYRDYTGDFMTCDHFVPLVNTLTNQLFKNYIGELPWDPVRATQLTRYLPNGLFVQHEQTECCGAENLQGFVFPLLDRLHTPEDVYRWNKKIRFLQYDCLIDESYVQKMTKRMELDETIPGMSLTFSDECLYCLDEKLYPVVSYYLKRDLPRRAELEKRYPSKSKGLAGENEQMIEHARVLVQIMESGDRDLFERESACQKQRMLEQIRKKLPALKIDSI